MDSCPKPGARWDRLFLPLLLGYMVVACEPESPRVAVEEGAAVTEIAGPAASELLRTLVGRLTGAMEDGGPVGAIESCSTEAISLTRSVEAGLGPGFALKRTSHRYRNPDNAPDEAEDAALRYFEHAIQAGEPPPSSYVQRVSEEEYRYYQPLFLGEVCITCHGDRSVLDASVLDALEEKYPGDLAVGYEAGSFRGVVRVSVPAAAVEGRMEG